jgi:hypothetical protein
VLVALQVQPQVVHLVEMEVLRLLVLLVHQAEVVVLLTLISLDIQVVRAVEAVEPAAAQQPVVLELQVKVLLAADIEVAE